MTGRSVSWWLGQIVLFFLLWVSLIQLPEIPSVQLDTSWHMVLSFAASAGLQHGHDLTFTYGPLGYLATGGYTGDLFYHHIAWQILSNLLIAAAIYSFGRNLSRGRQAIYYAYLFCIGYQNPDTMQMMVIAILALRLTERAFRRPRWIVLVAGVFAIFSLIKFTHLMVCTFSLVTVGVYYLVERAPRHTALLLGFFIAMFVGGWLACGQTIGNLPAYLYYGLQLSNAYTSAMGSDETPGMFALGMVTIACLALYLGLYFFTSLDRVKAGCSTVLLGAIVFLNWKHGFIRADDHVFMHYSAVLMVACMYPVLLADNSRWSLFKQLSLGIAFVVSLIAFSKFGLSEEPAEWNSRVRKTLGNLLDLSGCHQALDQKLEIAAAGAAMPGIRRFVGHETVDHLGDDQGYTLLNRLHYTPRPCIQGYTTYNEVLNRLDESFYRSDRAPHFVIQRYRSIDGRLIALDDSLTQKLIYQNYDYVLEEAGLILWEHPQKIQPADPAREKIVLSKTAHFGEAIALPDVGDQPVWAVVRIPQNFLGDVRQFLYKPPALFIDVEDEQRGTRAFRFIRAMGAAGFVLQPYFPDSDELIAFQTGRPARKIRSFTLRTSPGGEAYYASGIEIELRTIAPFKRGADGLKPDAPHRFRMMNRVPESLSSQNSPVDAFVNGEHLLQMHPSSIMTFAIDQPINSLSAAFGLMPGAEAVPNGTLGVEFIVEWQSADGRIERLYSRLLDPRNRLEDRGRQTLKIDLGGRHNGKLSLRTEPGPTGNKSYCWSYWTGIEIL